MSTTIPNEPAHLDEVRQLRARIDELEREQRISRRIIENAHVMISIVRGPDFVYELVNPAFQALAPEKEFVGHRFGEVWAEVSDPLVEILQKVIDTGEAFHLEDAPYTIQRGPGAPPEVVYVSYSWIPVADLDGRPDCILTFAHETTDSVRQRQAALKMEADRQLLETLVTNFPAGAALIRGSDLEILRINPAYQANAPGKAIIGKTVDEVWPEYYPKFKDTCLHVLATGAAYQAVDEPITICRAADASPELTFWTWSLIRVRLPGEEGWGLLSVTIETTERMRAEQARRDSQNDFETLANLVPQLVWMCKPDGSNFYFNQRWARYTGLSLEESYGTGWNTPFHPDYKQAARDAWKHATETGERYSIESPLRGADGGYRWFLIVGEPLKDAAGNVVRWFGTCTDIEGLKRAEEALRNSELRFRALTLASSDMLYRMSPDAREMRQLQGRGFVSDMETPSAGWLQKRVHPDDHARTMAAVNDAVSGKSTFQLEHRLIRDDGSLGWVLSRAVPLLDENGNIIEWFGASSDITLRKQAEESLRQQAALLDLAHDAIFVRGEGDRVTFWNHGAESTYGFSREEAIGQITHRLLNTRFPEPLATIREALLEKGRWEGELVHTRKDGREITVASRWALQRDPSGAELGIMEVNRDITARKQMEQGLRESRDQLAMAQRIAQAGSFDLDLKTKVVVCSEELQRLYGMAPGQTRLDMDLWAGWILPEDRERALADIEAGIASGEVLTQFRIRCRDSGRIRWIDRRGQVLRDESGAPVRLLGFSIDITEQKSAEEKLRQSMERERTRSAELEAVMNAIPGVIFVSHDPECRYVFGNQASYDLLRQEPGRNLSSSAPENERPSNFRVIRNAVDVPSQELPLQKAALTGQAVRNSELQLLFVDGSSVYFAGGAAPMLTEDGRPHGAVAVFVDITERKRSEQALQDSEERLRLAQEAGGIGHFDWNLLTGEIAWSESLKRIVAGPPAGTVELWDELLWIHADDRQAFDAQLKSAVSGQTSKVSISYRCIAAAGGPCWQLCEARVHRDQNGTPARMLGVIADITAHKQAEQAQQIEQERKHLEAGFRTFTDGVLLSDGTGRVLSVNPAAMRMLHLDELECVPRTIAEFADLFEITHLDGRSVSWDEWPAVRAFRGETTIGGEFRSRNRKTGHTWTASYGCAPVLDGTGNVIMVVLGIHDTSVERAATEEVQRSNAALHALSRQLLRLQDEERKRIARELHDGTLQMITAISMNLLMIGRSPNVVGEDGTLGLIAEAQELAKRCSRELRTVSYLLHPPDLEELGLVAALRSWADGFAHRTGIVLDVNLDDPGRLGADFETALFRIAQEALANVQRHSKCSRAEVNLFVSERVLRLEVSDDGIGVPREIIDREPERLGVGILGMRERARQLGGSLEIFRQAPGTTVRAILPRRSA